MERTKVNVGAGAAVASKPAIFKSDVCEALVGDVRLKVHTTCERHATENHNHTGAFAYNR